METKAKKQRVFKSTVRSIEFVSQTLAERVQPLKNWAIISITDESTLCFYYGVGIQKADLHPKWDDVLRLRFEDVSQSADSGAFTLMHARQIIEFLDKIRFKTTFLLVHCWAGISRSAAVAKFAAAYLDCPMFEVKYRSYTHYNELVYQTLMATAMEEQEWTPPDGPF